MTKNDLMKIKKYKDFKKVLCNMGYNECCNGGSHKVFRCEGKPSLSIPAHSERDEIAPGTRRNIIKLILG